MAISRRAIGTVVATTTTSLAVAWPSNVVNDVALLFWQTTNSAPATPAGWTMLYNTPTSNNLRTAVYYQFITSVQSGSVALTDTVTTHQAFIATYAGVDTLTAPTISVKNGTKSTSWSTNSVTWSGSYAVALMGETANTFTLSAIASSSGTFTSSVAVNATTSTYQATLIDGALSSAVTASINATASPSTAYGAMAIVLAVAIFTPVASFTANPTSGAAPLTTNFTDTSTNTPTSWSWTFGDGGTSTSQNPSYTYSTAGTYTVSNTATNSAGSNTSTQTNLITVSAITLPYTETWTGTDGSQWPGGWTGNQTYGTGGSATIVSSAGQMQSGAGATYGYREELVGMPVIVDTDVIANFVYPSQVDGFVRFGLNANTTPSANTGWKWAGTNGYFLQFATNATATAATYQVVKQISDVQTGMIATTSTTITAGVTYGVRFQRLGTTIRFKLWATSGGEPTAWTDSATDAGTTPPAGLIILSIGSSSTSANRIGSFDNLTVSVPAIPVASFTATPTSGASPLTSNFTDTSTNTPTSWSWDFGDGVTSTVQSPSHTYTIAGTYTVALTATNVSGSNTSTRTNYINAQVTIPYTETWTGTNATAWPAAWTNRFGATTIQSNAGQATPAATGTYAPARADLTSMPVSGNTDVTGTVIMAATGVEQYVVITIDSDGTFSSVQDGGNNSYALVLDYSVPRLTLRAAINGTKTDLVYQPWSLIGTRQYNFRFQRMGLFLRARVWNGTEPSTWDITYTVGNSWDSNSGTPLSGIVALASVNGNNATSRTATFDTVTISASDFSLPLPYTETWTGTDGSTWPSVWSTVNNVTIASNTGAFNPLASYGITTSFLKAIPASMDLDVVFTFTIQYLVETYIAITLDSSDPAGSFYSNNGYLLEIGSTSATGASGSWYGWLQKVVSNTRTSLGASTLTGTMTLAANTTYGVRLQLLGTTLRYKLWNTSIIEPWIWNESEVDGSTRPNSGQLAITASGGAGSGNTIALDNLSVSVPTTTITLVRSTRSVLVGTASILTLPGVYAGHGLILTSTNWDSANAIGHAIASISDSAGGSWQRATAGYADATIGEIEVWYCTNHPGSLGTLTVTATITGSSNAGMAVSLSEWSTPITQDYAFGAEPIGTTPSATVSSTSNDLVVSVVSMYDDSTPAPNAATTLASLTSTYRSNITAYTTATTTSTTMTYATGTSGQYGIVLVSFKQAPSSYGQVKAYTGGGFAVKPMKAWNGTTWVIKPLKEWNGTAWVPTKY